jgi:hypothetical protein
MDEQNENVEGTQPMPEQAQAPEFEVAINWVEGTSEEDVGNETSSMSATIKDMIEWAKQNVPTAVESITIKRK